MIGWTYESNRTKIKEAEKALSDFQLEDSITDLENAKEAELQYLEERITNWSDYLEMLNKKYNEYEELENDKLMMELLGVTSEKAVQNILMNDLDTFTKYASDNTESFLEDQIGAYRNYSSVFNDFLSDYTANNKELAKLRRTTYDELSDEAYHRAIEENGEALEEFIEYYENEYIPNVHYDAPEEKETYTAPLTYETAKKLSGYNSTTGAYYEYDEGATQAQIDAASKLASIQMRLNQGYDVTVDGTKYTSLDSFNAAGGSSLVSADTTYRTSGTADNTNYSTNAAGSKVQTIKEVNSTNYNAAGQSITQSGRTAEQLLSGYTIAETGKTVSAYNVVFYDTKGNLHATNQLSSGGNNGGKTVTINGEKVTVGEVITSAANGILAGPVEYTGLAMLHGSKSSPEYVLNSDQAYNLLANLATKKVSWESATTSGNSTSYIVQGDVVLEGVNDPEQFWNEVTAAMSNRWNVTKNK